MKGFDSPLILLAGSVILGYIACEIYEQAKYDHGFAKKREEGTHEQHSSAQHPSDTGGGAVTTGGTRGPTLYKSTGRSIAGTSWKVVEQECWKMASGGCRASSRFQFANSPNCVPFKDLEVTTYVHVGPRTKEAKGTPRLILGTGGGPQTKNNCCIYSVGYDAYTGHPHVEIEGAHDPSPHIYPIVVQGGEVGDIGALANREIGLKNVLWHDQAGTQLEGWVDANASGQWRRFYKGTNPKAGGLGPITHPGMAGDPCQEARARVDGHWPVKWDASKTFVSELALPPSLQFGLNDGQK